MLKIPKHLLKYSPVVCYMRCRGAGRPMREYVGNWPKRHRVYPCTIKRDVKGHERVFVAGVGLPLPYFGFQRWRFKLLAEVWLN